MLAVLMMSASSIPGGWKEVDQDSEFVQNVLPYVHRNYMKILPEYRKRNTLCVFKKAMVQIVNGYNIQLLSALGKDEIKIDLHVSPQQKITLRNFAHLPANDITEQVGGWKIQDPSYSPELVGLCINQYNAAKGINAVADKIILVRTQVVAGIKVHVVFLDHEGNTHSTIVYRKPSGEMSMEYGNSF